MALLQETIELEEAHPALRDLLTAVPTKGSAKVVTNPCLPSVKL